MIWHRKQSGILRVKQRFAWRPVQMFDGHTIVWLQRYWVRECYSRVHGWEWQRRYVNDPR